MGPRQTSIESKLNASLKLEKLEIFNDSHKHAHHSAMKGVDSQETHFRLNIISDDFQGKTLMQRHRLIYDILDDDIGDGKIHALQLNTKTITEYQKLNQNKK